ncbi:general transcription factor IIE subunit 1 [Trichuris trichiura]|uniref:General transcription factor IIE subunit 1 n=1 Tax=Trichuris trichiura TaxID=36087 RepID=A0A077Z6H9_TRITR|nr:general transcription factor IIE subunit 1 [Trichuris trichiura]
MDAGGGVKVVNEVPDNMLRLIRLVTKAFYGPEFVVALLGVVIDLLIRNVSMREEELRSMLKFEPKQLRGILITLKNDKIVKERQETEPRAEGRPLRHNYYFISYASMLNMVKYKLDLMRKKLESQENSSSNRSSFKCTKCSKVYSDLEINVLWNGQEMKCVYCANIVVENDVPSGIQLAPHLLEPDPPAKLRLDRLNREDSHATNFDSRSGKRSGRDLHDGANFAGPQFKSVVIADNTVQLRDTPKEIPAWMQSSTVRNEAAFPSISSEKAATTAAEADSKPNDIVMKLLAHENISEEAGTAKQEEDDEDSDFEDVPEQITVTVQGQPKSLEELMANPVLVNSMTEEEKERYVQVTQQAFQHFYMD